MLLLNATFKIQILCSIFVDKVKERVSTVKGISQLQWQGKQNGSTSLELALKKNAACFILTVASLLFVFCQCHYNTGAK